MSLTYGGVGDVARRVAALLPVGTVVASDAFSSTLLCPQQVYCDAPELAAHQGKPWLNAYLQKRHGLSLHTSVSRTRPGDIFAIDPALLARHTVICGASGSGKTRLALHLLKEQLRAGCSAVVMDFKEETVRHALACASDAGLTPEQITLLLPSQDKQGVPGWNPFVGDPASVRQAVREFVHLIEQSTTSWGPRLADVLTNAATVIAAQQLSLLELTRFLQREDYREGLLKEAVNSGVWEEFGEEHEYFLQEFCRLSKSEQTSAVGPVLNKVRSLVAVKYLRALLCARQDSVDLPSLWQRQRLLVVHLDSWSLGSDGMRLLSGMLSYQLFNAAMRKSGPVPVVLCMDEMGMQERFVGKAVCDILAIARSQNLRMMAACQHLDQLSDTLKTALLSNTALGAFFRLGPDDARRVAGSLSTGIGSQVTSLEIGVTRHGKHEPVEMEQTSHQIVDIWDNPICVHQRFWEEFARVQTMVSRSQEGAAELIRAMRALMDLAKMPRAYVKSPATGEVYEFSGYVRGLTAQEFSFHGPAPLRLVVKFPRPNVTILEKRSEAERQMEITKTLMELPVQQAIVRTATGTLAHLKVVDIALPARTSDLSVYLASGQDSEEIEDTYQWRRAMIEAIAAPILPHSVPTHIHLGRLLPEEPEAAFDGSL